MVSELQDALQPGVYYQLTCEAMPYADVRVSVVVAGHAAKTDLPLLLAAVGYGCLLAPDWLEPASRPERRGNMDDVEIVVCHAAELLSSQHLDVVRNLTEKKGTWVLALTFPGHSQSTSAPSAAARPWRVHTARSIDAVDKLGEILTAVRLARREGEAIACLHRACVQGDQEARDEIANLLFNVVRQDVRRALRTAPPDAIETGCADAFVGYFTEPDRYNPARGTLRHWIRTSAMRKTIDAIRWQTRRYAHEHYGVALDLIAGPVDGQALGHAASDRFEYLRERLLASAHTIDERSFVLAWLAGQSTSELAMLLPHVLTDSEDVARQVRRLQERLRQRVKRSGW